jgi:hypothetical protein
MVKEKIYSLDLIYAGAPVSFVIPSMEEIGLFLYYKPNNKTP